MNDSFVLQRTLEREIRGCQVLVIWTDCDREGENIGFEVIQVCQAGRLQLLFILYYLFHTIYETVHK